MLRISVLLLGLLGALPASANGAIEIKEGYAYPPIGTNKVAVGYLSVTNNSEKDDALVSGQSTMAQTVEIHDHIHENGVMRMRQVKSVPLAAGETVVMKSGGLHLMIIGVKESMEVGSMVPVTLTLSSGAQIDAQLEVRARGR